MSADHSAVSDCDTGENRTVRSQPDVIPDLYWLHSAGLLIDSQSCRDPVIVINHKTPWREKDVVTNLALTQNVKLHSTTEITVITENQLRILIDQFDCDVILKDTASADLQAPRTGYATAGTNLRF